MAILETKRESFKGQEWGHPEWSGMAEAVWPTEADTGAGSTMHKRQEFTVLQAWQGCAHRQARQYSSQARGSQSVVPEPAAAASPIMCDECQFLGPIPELLDQNSGDEPPNLS